MNRQQVFEAGAKGITLQNFIDKTVLIPVEPDSLRQERVDFHDELTEEDITEIVHKLAKKCSQAVKYELASKLGDLDSLYCVDQFTRLDLSPDGSWMYTAGQDYPSEVARLRAALLR